MQQLSQLSDAESLSGIWSAIHCDVDFVVKESEIHYLQTLALAVDDDVVSFLLLKKLKLARRLESQGQPGDAVVLNSFVEFDFDGGPRTFGQLVRPSPRRPNFGIGIDSLLGVGLLGLRSGQTIDWPNDSGVLCVLHLARVENCPGMTSWLTGIKG